MNKQKILKCFTFACAFLLVLVPTVSAQETSTRPISPEKRALISELFEVTQLRKTADELHKGMMEQQRQITRDVILQSMEINPEYKELSDANREKVRKEMLENSERTDQRATELITERINFPTLIAEISYQLYDKYFTESELKDLLVFYRSSTGKKAIEVVPKLFAESMELARVALQPKMAEVLMILSKEESERIDKELEALKAQMEAAKPPPVKRRTNKRRRP
jgi:hypothetical protein